MGGPTSWWWLHWSSRTNLDQAMTSMTLKFFELRSWPSMEWWSGMIFWMIFCPWSSGLQNAFPSNMREDCGVPQRHAAKTAWRCSVRFPMVSLCESIWKVPQIVASKSWNVHHKMLRQNISNCVEVLLIMWVSLPKIFPNFGACSVFGHQHFQIVSKYYNQCIRDITIRPYPGFWSFSLC